MTNLTRRQILMGGTAIAAAGLIPSIPQTPLTPAMKLMQSAIAENLPRPDTMLRLHANENPYGPSRVALKAVAENMDLMNLYSFGPRDLAVTLAEINGVSKDMVLVGTGSNEILRVAGMMASQSGGSIVCVDPTYQALLRYAENSGSKIIRVPVDENLNADLDALRAAIRDDTYMVYLVNPNNPVPSVIEKNALREFVLEIAEQRMVFVDEAYHEYAESPDYESMMGLLAADNKNIVISRTASKIHGLAGMRVGFGFAHPDLITRMKRLKTGETNILGVKAAEASYRDSEFQDFARRKNKESLGIVEQMCEELDLRYIKSNTNFAFIETGMKNKVLQERMKEYGILIGRNFAPFQDSWSRISMSKPDDMRYFVQVYKQLFG